MKVRWEWAVGRGEKGGIMKIIEIGRSSRRREEKRRKEKRREERKSYLVRTMNLALPAFTTEAGLGTGLLSYCTIISYY